MMRDIPQVFLFMFLGVVGIMLIFTNYVRGFTVDDEVLTLNTSVRMALTSETDEASRVYTGVAFLSRSFESTLWSELSEVYPDGSLVEILYVFDHEDARFSDRTIEHRRSSGVYKIGRDAPPTYVNYLQWKPLESVRVRVKLPTDNVDEWTYQTTVKVDFPRTSPLLRNVINAREQLRMIDGALAMYQADGSLSDYMRGRVAEVLGVSGTVLTESYLSATRVDILAVKHSNELLLDAYDE